MKTKLVLKKETVEHLVADNFFGGVGTMKPLEPSMAIDYTCPCPSYMVNVNTGCSGGVESANVCLVKTDDCMSYDKCVVLSWKVCARETLMCEDVDFKPEIR